MAWLAKTLRVGPFVSTPKRLGFDVIDLHCLRNQPFGRTVAAERFRVNASIPQLPPPVVIGGLETDPMDWGGGINVETRCASWHCLLSLFIVQSIP